MSPNYTISIHIGIPRRDKTVERRIQHARVYECYLGVDLVCVYVVCAVIVFVMEILNQAGRITSNRAMEDRNATDVTRRYRHPETRHSDADSAIETEIVQNRRNNMIIDRGVLCRRPGTARN